MDVKQIIAEEAKKLFSQSFYDEQDAYVNEIGEASIQPYEWWNTNEKYMEKTQRGQYNFKTDDGLEYDVFFNRPDLREPDWRVDFNARDPETHVVYTDTSTNKGEPLKIMATVADIIKDFSIKMNPQVLNINAAKEGGDDGERRLNLYQRFVEKNVPQGYGVKREGDRIVVYRNNKAEYFEEGVGDKYAEKTFGIPDADKEYSRKGVPDADMGEQMTPIWATTYKGEKQHHGFIYKNPKTLKGFDVDVRAIAFRNGDIYVAQQDGDFIHTDMELSLEKKVGFLDEYIELHRAGDSNTFGISDTLNHTMEEYDVDPYPYYRALEKRFPQYRFSLDYYQDLREGVGDKYLQNKGVAADSGQQFQDQWQQKQKADTQDVNNGELVASIPHKKDPKDASSAEFINNVYKNPRSLENFDKDVRAISDNEGNLYVSQLNTLDLHDNIGEAVGIKDVYDTTKYMTWVRIGDDNKFYHSYSFRAMYKLSGELHNVFQKRMKVLKQKQGFEFLIAGPMYEVVNEVEDNANHTPDEMPFIMEEQNIKSPQEIADGLRRSEYWDRMEANNPDYYKDEKPILANVDMELADKAFREDHDFYIGTEDDGIGNRKERVLQNIRDGVLMYAPDVSIRMGNNNVPVLSFGDGRHRFAVLRDLGVESINMTFNKDSKDYIHLLQR